MSTGFMLVGGRQFSYDLFKVEASSWQHHSGDKKPPTRYEVVVGVTHIGVVFSKSSKTVRSRMRSGVIVSHYKGFCREWEAERIIKHGESGLLDRSVTKYARTRKDAIKRLIEDAVLRGVIK